MNIKTEINESEKIIYKSSKLGKKIINYTKFLPADISIPERILYINNDIHSQVQCPTCSNISNIDIRSKYLRIKFCSTICRSNYIDDSGLTFAQINGLKAKITKSKINKTTGLTHYQEIANKSAITMSKLDEDGFSIYDKSKAKIKKTNLKIDPLTGLNGYERTGEKNKKLHSKVDKITGLTGYQLNGLKSKRSNLKIDPLTGLNSYQKNSIFVAKKLKLKKFQEILTKIDKKFTLITTKENYINSHGGTITYKCNRCNNTIESYYGYIRCTTCHPYNKSIAENEVLEYCQSLFSVVLSGNRKIIKPLELDVYLPDHNLAIEYDGLFWHSSECKDKDYHLNKTTLCQEKGIQLFHIFENEWINPVKQKIWKSIIKNRLGQSSRIYARKTEVAQITSKDKKQFLIDNHLQGDCASSVNLGLYLGDELVSVMTFGRSRYDKKVDWELLRFCNKVGYSVVGGGSKLLASFRRENDGSIISYADKRRSTGGLYKALGFELSHESPPNYWYWKIGSMKLESRIAYQKHKLKDKLDTFDSELTEYENMYANKYRKIYDCGNQVWKIV